MSADRWIAEVALPLRAQHGEGPLWDDRSGELLWVDQYLGLIRWAKADASGSLAVVRTHDVGGPIGAVVLRERGGWMLAARNGFQTLDDDLRGHAVVHVLPSDGIRRRMNDGKVDLDGRFWAGSMAFDKTPGAGSLYVLDGDRTSTALESVTISNGLAWNAAGDRLYYVDTPTGVIRQYAVGDGAIRDDLGVLVTAPDGAGFDGMCIDEEGCLWVALWGAARVHRYDLTGRLVGVVEVDAPQVSSCAFGGPGLDTLFITTSQEGYTPELAERRPSAGCLFAVHPGVRGLRAERFRG